MAVFPSTRTGVSGCNRDSVACKADNIYYFDFLQRLLTPKDQSKHLKYFILFIPFINFRSM